MNDQNPLNWLPEPGQTKEIPGGYIKCESIEFSRNMAKLGVEGNVKFSFFVCDDEWLNSNHNDASKCKSEELKGLKQ